MEHEKYSYVEAIRWLAQKYGIEIIETESTPEQKIQLQIAESLHALNHFAQQYFSDALFTTDEGKSIGLGYLKHRGFRDNIIQKFQIGYCPVEDAFVKEALRNQYNTDLLIKSGLVTDRDGKLRDNYRERIIFPIHNQTGKVIGFGARQIRKNDKSPKYINTPENEVYVKSRVLYGLWQARQAISKMDECLLVEGYTDVISLHQAGIENVVASGGTSLTKEQLRLIKKITTNLTIFYDGDAAGIAAALRGLNLALQEGLTVRMVILPPPEDPDSYVNKYGAQTLEKYILENKKDFIFFQLEYFLKEAGDDPIKKSAAVKKIAESVSLLSRPEEFTLKQDYIRKVSSVLQVDEGGFINLVNSIAREHLEKQQNSAFKDTKEGQPVGAIPSTLIPGSPDTPQDADVQELIKKDLYHEQALVRCLLEYGNKPYNEESSVGAFLLKEFSIEDSITDELLLTIVKQYRTLYDENLNPDIKYFIYSDELKISSTVVSLIAFPYELSKGWKDKFNQQVASKESQYKEDINSSIRYFELKKIRSMIEENEKELGVKQTEDKLSILLQTHQHLKEMERNLTKEVGLVIFR